MHSNNNIRVLLAYDNTIVREGLRLLFESEPDMEIFDAAADNRSLAQLACELDPNVIVMDFNTPETDNIPLSRQILDDNPNISIVALIGHAHGHVLDEALKTGISGFVMMESSFNEVSAAVRAAYEGKTYMCPETKNLLAIGYMSRIQADEQVTSSDLTDRECEIIRLLSLGMTSKEIAIHMEVSSKTVDAGRRKIMDKLGIDSIAELVKHAIRIGLATV